MVVVEQTAVIEAPAAEVMRGLNDVKNFPVWATVEGVVDNVQGFGVGMTYEWHYSVEGIKFEGRSEVIEQSEDTLITRTTGTVESLWTIGLTALGNETTAIHVVVEYNPPNKFVEVLADQVLQRYATPEVASDNLNRFKAFVEQKMKIAE